MSALGTDHGGALWTNPTARKYGLVVVDSEYFCTHCECVHRYSDSDDFQLHRDFAAGHRRMIYEETP